MLLNPTWPHKEYCYFSQFRVEETEAQVSRGGGAGPEWRQPDSGTPTISGHRLQDVTLDGAGETDLRVGGSLAPS